MKINANFAFGFAEVGSKRHRRVREELEDDDCTSDKDIISKLLSNYKEHKTPSETGVIVWIEVSQETSFLLTSQLTR